MRKMLWFMTLCMGWVLVGCQHSALMTMQQENRESEGRIVSKERELRDLETERMILEEDKESLLDELDSRQMSLDEVATRLDRLRKQNARLRADTDRERGKKADLDARIAQCQREIDALERNDQLSTAEKARRIEDLKDRIRALLKIR
ncbi:MAG: hypothetical protein MUF52_11000 [Syntrophobacteraceae bacterium]|nr:hypothetical protein [Syntrophobacteraceae bacterium]